MKALDLTGQRFGKLIVVKRAENTESGSARWECVCDCGGITRATTSILRSNHKKSCGCVGKINLKGRRFGMLVVIEEIKERSHVRVLWRCLCDCGQFTKSSTANLTGGLSRSCGCVRTKHNGKGTRLYRIWAGMKDRCLNIKSKYWMRYGGRGITICQEWAKDFAIFREWALANGYENNLTIDKIDNDKGYCPSNCQWLTRAENAGKGVS
jgi:hypothetical protein